VVHVGVDEARHDHEVADVDSVPLAFQASRFDPCDPTVLDVDGRRADTVCEYNPTASYHQRCVLGVLCGESTLESAARGAFDERSCAGAADELAAFDHEASARQYCVGGA